MRYLIVLLMLTLASCSSSNDLGKCVGLNGHEDPKLNYEYSAWNIGVGIVFSELIVPPIIVALDELKCPVSKKGEEK